MFSIKVEDDLELGFYTERNAEEVYRVVNFWLEDGRQNCQSNDDFILSSDF